MGLRGPAAAAKLRSNVPFTFALGACCLMGLRGPAAAGAESRRFPGRGEHSGRKARGAHPYLKGGCVGCGSGQVGL